MKIEPKQMSLARNLRRHQTDAERIPWSRLQNKRLAGLKFRRRQPLGPYIADFICFDRKVILEIDGGQHNEPGTREGDEERTAWSENMGYRVLRFWNNEVLANLEGVLENRTSFAAPLPPPASFRKEGRAG